ncbi:hypothetical protein EMIT0215P_90247 [Pseudomonas serboccidentalis]
MVPLSREKFDGTLKKSRLPLPLIFFRLHATGQSCYLYA